MKRLEGEVLNLLHDLGESQGLLELEGVTVDPHQFLGLEINPRAARIAEMVLWIGYLQWHYRTHGKVSPPEPVLRDFKNIENRDALLSHDAVDLVTDEAGKPITRWDGITTRISPITGEPVPDEAARAEQYVYRNPRKAQWPTADYIVGNPPFIGASTMRRALGDGYVDAVRRTWPEVPESADFVMHWWYIAAETVRAGQAEQFGFITTNSIRQTFNRRVIQGQLEAKKDPLSLAFAIPDHPWVDAGDGAQVRIAMTVGGREVDNGRLLQVRDEYRNERDQDDIAVQLYERRGALFSDLKIGADVAASESLQANEGLTSRGMMLFGAGFIVTPEEATNLGLGATPGLERYIRDYRNGRDLAQSPRRVMVIDFFGLSVNEVHERFPAAYQHILERVKPERDQNKDRAISQNWWLHGRTRAELRNHISGLPRYIATVETTKHRVFQFLCASILPDNMLVAIALENAGSLGVLSSRLHVIWALAAGGRLGVGNDPRYNKTRCFETFPFPETSPAQQARIGELAERLDAHRKRQQEQHPTLTLTGMYNVLEKLRSEESLNAKDKTIHEQGLVSVLRELHDELDSAVFAAYGWDDLAAQLVGRPGATTPLPDKPEAQAEAEEELLRRLVELNTQRSVEEARGHIRWQRPEYQNPAAATPLPSPLPQGERGPVEAVVASEVPPAAAAAGKLTWPKQMREQVAAVRDALAQGPLPTDAIAGQFKRSPKAAVQSVLEALEELGMVAKSAENYSLAR
ncbi:class I SAM-dependent DNA methyltransferase [Halopseudomonas litoralis]|nr:DNA methyltransferase [Halopseudomonas litoralis]